MASYVGAAGAGAAEGAGRLAARAAAMEVAAAILVKTIEPWQVAEEIEAESARRRSVMDENASG